MQLVPGVARVHETGAPSRRHCNIGPLAIVILSVATIFLAACGPMPVERAEAMCFERARLAVQPRGEVYIGASTDGPAVGGEVTVSSDYVQGRDPSAVYDACVYRNSGQPPRRPLYDRPDWRG